ncbi:MAG: hypothetical protein EB072_07760 [Betaproteobacteria bacterium]|nr:hypothetical protein [Betaproteobacteria bacterium]
MSLAGLGALLVAKAVFTPAPVCDPSVKSKTVILLDYSEDVSTQTKASIIGRAWKMIDEEVPEGELVSVFSLSKATKTDFKPLFSACKPRKTGSRTTEDVRRIRRDFEEKFMKPLRAELSAPIPGSDESPIAQALIDLSLDDLRFRSPDVTRLAVFSDFMENTSNFSMYKCSSPGEAVNQFRASRVGAVERPQFKNVDVRMHIIPRNNISRPALQCRDRFWMWFFGDNQGTCKNNSCLTPDYLPG